MEWEKRLGFEGLGVVGILAGQAGPFRGYYHEPLDAGEHQASKPYEQNQYQRWREKPEYDEGTYSAFDLGQPELVDEKGPPFC